MELFFCKRRSLTKEDEGVVRLHVILSNDAGTTGSKLGLVVPYFIHYYVHISPHGQMCYSASIMSAPQL